jgi:hypothetical protein
MKIILATAVFFYGLTLGAAANDAQNVCGKVAEIGKSAPPSEWVTHYSSLVGKVVTFDNPKRGIFAQREMLNSVVYEDGQWRFVCQNINEPRLARTLSESNGWKLAPDPDSIVIYGGETGAAHRAEISAAHLLPREDRVVKVGDPPVKYKLSDVFKDDSGRVYAFAEITLPSGISYFRVFWRSHGSSEFRILAAVNSADLKFAQIPEYDNLPGDAALRAPNEVQKLLHERAAGPVRDLGNSERTESLIRGSARFNRNVDDYIVYAQEHPEFSNPPRLRLLTNEAPMTAIVKLSPSAIKLKPENAPYDYSRAQLAYPVTSSLLTVPIEARVYPSNVGDFTVYVADFPTGKKIWFGGAAPKNGKISRFGNYELVMDGGPLFTPLYGHFLVAPPDYAGRPHAEKKDYVDNWDYIRQLPEVIRWYRENKIPIPAPD